MSSFSVEDGGSGFLQFWYSSARSHGIIIQKTTLILRLLFTLTKPRRDRFSEYSYAVRTVKLNPKCIKECSKI
jgi:hypothetical protein